MLRRETERPFGYSSDDLSADWDSSPDRAGLRAFSLTLVLPRSVQVGYRIAGMWLDDAEYAELLGDLTRVLQPRMANAPRKGRRRRILATVLLIGEDAPAEDQEEGS